MKHRVKLSQEQQHEAIQHSQQPVVREFGSVEELLRFDAAQTVVPPEIARRLEHSTREAVPAVRRPWWKSLLGH